MATTKQLTEAVCFQSGHKIISLVTKEFYEPATKSIIHLYDQLCEKCGLSVEQIRNYRGTVKRESGKKAGGE